METKIDDNQPDPSTMTIDEKVEYLLENLGDVKMWVFGESLADQHRSAVESQGAHRESVTAQFNGVRGCIDKNDIAVRELISAVDKNMAKACSVLANRINALGDDLNRRTAVPGSVAQTSEPDDNASPIVLFVETLAKEAHEGWRQSADRSYSPHNMPWSKLTRGQRASISRNTRGILDEMAKHADLFARPVIIDDPYEGVELEVGTIPTSEAGMRAEFAKAGVEVPDGMIVSDAPHPDDHPEPPASFLAGDPCVFQDPDGKSGPVNAKVITATDKSGRTQIQFTNGLKDIVNARCLKRPG